MEPILISPEEAKSMTVEEILEKFSAREQGLASQEAGERLQVYGFNEIAEKKVHPILKFLSYFWGPIPWMIEGAAATRPGRIPRPPSRRPKAWGSG